MNVSSREEIRETLIEELVVASGSRRCSAAMVARFEAGDLELPCIPSARAGTLARRLREVGAPADQ